MKKKFTILLMALAIMSIASVSAGVFLTHVENVTVDVVNVTDGEPFRDKCTNLTGGDAVICFNEYRHQTNQGRSVL